MTLTIAPADYACQSLVTQINAGTTYALDRPAEYSRTEIDELEDIEDLRIDVVAIDEKQPNDLLSANEQSSHAIKVFIRSKITEKSIDVPAMALLTRQIFLNLDNWANADQSVQVWECDVDRKENPLKAQLNELRLFVSSISLRVEVAR